MLHLVEEATLLSSFCKSNLKWAVVLHNDVWYEQWQNEWGRPLSASVLWLLNNWIMTVKTVRLTYRKKTVFNSLDQIVFLATSIEKGLTEKAHSGTQFCSQKSNK